MVGDGEPSDSVWEFAVSGMLVVTDVGDSAPFVVTVMCEGVSSDLGWDFVEPQSFPRRQEIGRLKDKRKRITWKEYERLLNEFEMEGFMAQKRFMESRERRYSAGQRSV